MKDTYLRKLNIELVDGDFKNIVQKQVRTPEQVYSLFKDIKDHSKETLLGLYLDSELNGRIYSVLSVGSEEHTPCDPAEIYKMVIVTNSKVFILIHNHPKGDPTPSEEDKKIIEEIKEGAKKLKLTFLDFMIVGEDSYWSMFEEGEGGEYSMGALSS